MILQTVMICVLVAVILFGAYYQYCNNLFALPFNLPKAAGLVQRHDTAASLEQQVLIDLGIYTNLEELYSRVAGLEQSVDALMAQQTADAFVPPETDGTNDNEQPSQTEKTEPPTATPGGSPLPIPEGNAVNLEDADYFNFYKRYYWNELRKVEGDYSYDNAKSHVYTQGVIYAVGNKCFTYIDYLVNKEYVALVGTWALTFPDRTTSGVGTLDVYGDDELVFTSGAQTNGTMPEAINIDISNYTKIRLEIRNDGGGSAAFGFYDAKLIKRS
jgi:hypothetical protein